MARTVGLLAALVAIAQAAPALQFSPAALPNEWHVVSPVGPSGRVSACAPMTIHVTIVALCLWWWCP